VVLVALALTAAAAVQFFIWACRGYFSVVLFTVALSMAIAALLLLPLLTILLRDGGLGWLLSHWFARLSVGMPVVAAIFAILGELRCAAGALIVSGLFGIMVAVLTLGRGIAERRR